MVLAPVVRGRKGEYGKLLEEMRAQGYARAVDRRRAAPPRRGDRARQEVQARHLGRGRPPGDEGGAAQAARRVGRGGALASWPSGLVEVERPTATTPGERPSAGKRGEVCVQREVRLPELRHLDAGARAADLLVQLAARLLPALPRARLPAGDRPRADRPRPDAVDLRGRARAVDEGRLDLPPAAARGGRRGERDRHRHAVAATCPSATASSCWRAPATSATRSPTATASAAGARTRVRFEGMLPSLQRRYERHRLREHPRADRGADGAAALPGVRRRAAAAGEPRGHGRRAQHLRVHAAVGARGARVDRGARADRDRARDRPAGGARDRRAAAVPGHRSASATCRSSAPRRRSRAARRSGSGSRRRSARAWWACSTSSTSPRSACTSATTRS